MRINELLVYLDELLQVHAFQDYCPNGLQVEGTRSVQHLVTGVTASQALLDAAIQIKADAILVHHGYFWKNESAPLVGMKGQRIRSLMQAGVHLLAYHLPLDAHPELGNNAQLARLFDWKITGPLYPQQSHPIGFQGELAQPMTAAELSQQLAQGLKRKPLHIQGHTRSIRRLAWCSGAAQGALVDAAALDVDAYISGEISEPSVHLARELGIDYFAAGHHATERYGVQALGEHLAHQFGLQHTFIEIDNPV
ncbi:dinuclear metal center protein, YbgI/SA1388 family [Allopseudospirillum japonicum]|uniref:Dinuclear metal center protein, YbgI/SA1388 family n=1 Tax=Allopseudospirillum japonicum TaxID=64971 RepID=A0A1H6QL73_9GAMM|nr:Nif3-like dinuclear metal center hexameric protein [Allopseudospirillum japonicum]SEI40887.1 dinuclear metal center protein, YbgI/SA1388 family [Allopseudospirillum japonicum]